MKVEICHGPKCGDYGGKANADALRERGILVQELPCQSLCQHAPVAKVNGIALLKSTPESIRDAVNSASAEDR